MFIYKGKEVVPGTPEADELAEKILTTLYEIAAAEKGCKLDSITFAKLDPPPATTVQAS